MPTSIAKISEGSLAGDPFKSQALSIRLCDWQQVAGVEDALRIDGLLELAQQRESTLAQIMMEIVAPETTGSVMMSDATTSLRCCSEGPIPAFHVAIPHYRGILGHAGKGEVQVDARAVNVGTVSGGIYAVRHRLECGNHVIINRVYLAPRARHFNRVGD